MQVTAGIVKPMGFERITSLSAAASLTVPDKARFALIKCETQNVRWRDDGTPPTSSVGMLMETGDEFEYTGDLHAIEFIETTASASLTVSYYR